MATSFKILKNYDDLTISDNFMFQRVMQNELLCKHLLEMALRIKIKRLMYMPNAEKFIKVSWEGKASRLDLYVELADGSAVDVEIQTTGNAEELAKRTRYYQSILDADNLMKGEYYTDLPKSYVIFICTFDPFGEKRNQYTFQNKCVENTDLSLNDGATKIFFNANGAVGDIDDELKNFLKYVKNGEITGEFTKAVAHEFEKVKEHKETKVEYMGLELEIQRQRLDEHKKTILDGIRKLMDKMNYTVEEAMDFWEIPQDEREKYIAMI